MHSAEYSLLICTTTERLVFISCPETKFSQVKSSSPSIKTGIDSYKNKLSGLLLVHLWVRDSVPCRGRRWWATAPGPGCCSSSPHRWSGGCCRASCRSRCRSRTRSAKTACPTRSRETEAGVISVIRTDNLLQQLFWLHEDVFSVMKADERQVGYF